MRDYLSKQVNKIYDTYIKFGAPDGIPLSDELRFEIIRSLDDPSPIMFNKTQAQVEDVLRDEIYIRFLSSSYCARLKEDILTNQISNNTLIEIRKKDEIQQLMTRTKDKNGTKLSIVSTFGNSLPQVSFDYMMQDSRLVSYFKDFLQANFALESFLFYLDLQQFKRVPQSDFLISVAKKIYMKYIKSDSNMNITYLKNEVRENIKLQMDISITSNIFSDAEIVVHEYLSVQKYSEFVKSRQYTEIPVDWLTSSLSISPSPSTPSAIINDKLTEGDIYRNKATKMVENVTLEDVLSDELCMKRYKEFCKKKLCQENLFFWLACEEYRYIPSNEYLRVIASKICNTYISDNAKQQVNLPASVRREIEAQLNNPTRKLFLTAQKAIYGLMECSLFINFLKAKEYQLYLLDLKNQSKDKNGW
jgi:hypothetical protein